MQVKPRTCAGNELYGHAQIIRDYVGITDKTPIRGRVQHGWAPHASVFYDELVTSGEPVYVWTERDRHNGYDGYRGGIKIPQAHAIGAPFLYMLGTEFTQIIYDVLAIPYHSLGGMKIAAGAWQVYSTWFAEFARCEGFGSAAVCLHPQDLNQDTLRIFTDDGVDVLCAGANAEPTFLYQLQKHILSSRTVISNIPSTALLYALWLKKPVMVAGLLLKCSVFDSAVDKEKTMIYAPMETEYRGMGREWSEDRQVAIDELGESNKRSCDDLMGLLWEGSKIAA